jgi:diguanylate cyclase (GGDEF)-like protein
MTGTAPTVPGVVSAVPARHRTPSRRAAWAWVTASYASDVAVVTGFAALGTVPWRVPAAHALAAAVVSATFFVLLRRPVTDPAPRDPYRTAQQVAAGTVVALGGLLLAPVLTLVFQNILFVVFAFGSLRMTRQQIVVGCVIASATTAFVLATAWPAPVALSTPAELALLALSYASTLARCAFVGLTGSRLRDELRRANDQLVTASERIERLARHDELTGLLNRRSIRALLEDHAALADRGMEDLAVAILDLDHFKSVNDRFGHGVGDQVLHAFGTLAAQTLRVTDHVGRHGGEEFLCVLTCSTVEDVQAAMERLRAAVAARDWHDLAPGLSVTISIGIAVFTPGQTVADLVRNADDALYAAKHQGRDRVILAA